MLVKLSDVVSISARYEKIFEQELCVRTALSDLYFEVLLFLQRIRTTISTGCKLSYSTEGKITLALTLLSAFKILVKSIFRSVDVEFQDNVQRLSRLNEVFKEEVTLAHRQHVEDHLKQQRLASSTSDRRAVHTEHNLIRQSKRDDQEG